MTRETQLLIDPVELLDVRFLVGFRRQVFNSLDNFESAQRAELMLAASGRHRQPSLARGAQERSSGGDPGDFPGRQEANGEFHIGRLLDWSILANGCGLAAGFALGYAGDMPTAGFLVIGNEILSGKVVDSNSPFLAKRLREIGVDLERILTIADDVEIIARELRAMSETFDYVMTSGGIGPTHDDVTMEAVAKAFDLPLELDRELQNRIEKATGDYFNESMRKMAMLPKGARVEEAGELWFPLISVHNVFILPGIPDLFERKFESVRKQLEGVPISLRRVYVTSHESEIAVHLNELLSEFSELMLGSYPRIGEADFRVMLTLESRDEQYLQLALDSLLSRLAPDTIHRVD